MGKRQHQSSKPLRNPVSLVLPPSLYLGPCSAASSKQFLTSNSITDVLSIGANPSQDGRVDGVTYHRLSIDDSTSCSISKVADGACETIDSAIVASSKTSGGNGKILVHCSAGISRSPMVVAAYLMRRKGMTLKAALGQIIRVRPQVSPNTGFLKQLKEMEMELFGTAVSSLEGVDELPKREKDRLALFEEGESEADYRLRGASLRVVHRLPSSSVRRFPFRYLSTVRLGHTISKVPIRSDTILIYSPIIHVPVPRPRHHRVVPDQSKYHYHIYNQTSTRDHTTMI